MPFHQRQHFRELVQKAYSFSTRLKNATKCLIDFDASTYLVRHRKGRCLSNTWGLSVHVLALKSRLTARDFTRFPKSTVGTLVVWEWNLIVCGVLYWSHRCLPHTIVVALWLECQTTQRSQVQFLQLV